MIRTSGRRIDTIFVLIIFSIFALSVLMVLMLGASIYKSMTDITKQESEESTILSYIWTKSKSNDKNGSIRIGEYFGLPVLCFDEEYDGIKYTTAIYHYEEWVYELYTETELLAETDPKLSFYPEDGIRVMPIISFDFAMLENGLIEVSAGKRNLLLYPRSGNNRDVANVIIA